MAVKARPTVIVPVKNRAALRDHWFDKGGQGGVFVEGDLDISLGEEVDLDLQFIEEQVSIRIRGQARWRRTSPSGRRSMPPGLGIEILPEEAAARELLLEFARGKEIALVLRRARRFGVLLRVKYQQDGAAVFDNTDDISEGGAFILSDAPLPVGTRFEMKLVPPGAFFGVGVTAVVAWRRNEGRRGFGVEFQFDSERQRKKVAKMVEELKEQMQREEKVRVPRKRPSNRSA